MASASSESKASFMSRTMVRNGPAKLQSGGVVSAYFWDSARRRELRSSLPRRRRSARCLLQTAHFFIPRPTPSQPAPGGVRVNKETLSPFDMTVYKGAAWPGQPKDITYRSEAEEMAFSVHVKTARASPDSAKARTTPRRAAANAH